MSFSPIIGLGGGASSVVSKDDSALEFIERATIVDDNEKDALNDLAITLKADDVWDDIFALYPFVGSTAAKHSHNLVSSNYPITWTAVTHNGFGITGNGTTAFGRCVGLSGTVHGALCGMSAYVRVPDSVTQFARTMGQCNEGQTQLYMLDRINLGGFESERGFLGDLANVLTSASVPARNGFFSVNRTAANAIALYRNGVSLVTGNTVDSLTVSPFDVYLLGLNFANTLSTPSAANLSTAVIHKGLTPAKALALYTRVQAFQTALGRAE